MKKILVVFFLLTGLIFAQQLKVKQIIQLTSVEDGMFLSPQISSDGEKIFFSGPNYQGLFYKKINGSEIIKVTDAAGAGYEPVFSNDGKYVFYRTYTYKGMKRYSSLIKQNLENNEIQEIESEIRNLSTPQKLNNGNVVYNKEGNINSVNNNSEAINKNEFPYVEIERRKIQLYQNGVKKTIEPYKDKIYIWPSVSSDGTKLLFTVAGQSTYISDLNGNILVDLGTANAPQWSPDGNWVVYMDDKDDGHIFTASEIFAVSADGKSKFQLTNTENIIEMYPQWGSTTQSIVFASNNGQIYLMELMEE